MSDSNPESKKTEIEADSQAIQIVTCRCGSEVDARRNHCVYCGRPLYRICFCGKRIQRSLSSCPYCGMRWDREKIKIYRKRLPVREKLKILSCCIGLGLVLGAAAGLTLEVIQLVILRILLPPAPPFASSLHNPSEGLSSTTYPSLVDRIAGEVYNFVISIFMLVEQLINCEFFLKHPLIGISIIIGVGLGTVAAYRRLALHHGRRRRVSIARRR